MINDRGTMKWTAFIMPEHKQSVKKYFNDDLKIEKPELDEQQIEEINLKIADAMEFNQELVFYYYRYGEIRFIIGRVHHVDTLKREFKIMDEHQYVNIIKFDDLVDVKNK
ncbi:YolD-like family protein [Metabacillus sp. Hm71]|uniref:YolD-like family protein n=1 Tax=Metabacillus sp. Hm71 TaxID=3450743 RepID=UPI003F41CD7F